MIQLAFAFLVLITISIINLPWISNKIEAEQKIIDKERGNV